MPVGEQQHGVTVYRPEAAQKIPRRIRQRNKTVFVALGATDMDALTRCIEIPHFQAQAFTEPQTEAIEGEIEDPVAQFACCLK